MRYQSFYRLGTLSLLALSTFTAANRSVLATDAVCPTTNTSPGQHVQVSASPANAITTLFKATGETKADSFGEGIATSDVNGDGDPDIIVGARGDVNAGSTSIGKVYVYKGGNNGISTTAVVVLQGESSGGEFGRTVAAAGDITGSGFQGVMVSAHGFDAGKGFHQGKVYFYMGSKNGLSDKPSFTLVGEAANSDFGRSLLNAGDLFKDGHSAVVVGAPGFSGTVNGQGKVYVYRGTATGLDPTPIFTALGDIENAEFGRSVAIADVNGDGYLDLTVSAPGLTRAGGSSSSPGAVYVYMGNATGFSATPSVVLHGELPGNKFGESIASVGDINGDGFDDIVVGARDYHCGPSASGKVYVFFGSAKGLSATPAFTAIGSVPNGGLGRAVGFVGDVNGDGYNDVLVGAPAGGPDQAAAYIYPGGPTGVSSTPILLTDGGKSTGFGFAVSSTQPINSKVVKGKQVQVVIGAPVGGDQRQGQVFVYSIVPGTLAAVR